MPTRIGRPDARPYPAAGPLRGRGRRPRSCQRTRVCFQRLLDLGYGTRHLDRRAMGADSPAAAVPEAQDRAPEQRPSQRRERHLVDRPHRSALARPSARIRSVAERGDSLLPLGEVKAGVWDRVLGELQRQADAQGELDWKLHHVDGSVVRAHQHAAGAKKGGAPASRQRRRQGREKIRRRL